MDIKCIALDLDGTVLNSEGKLSEKNRAAIESAIANGIHIVIASGRSFWSLPEEILSIPGIEYAITSNGAAVYHVPTETRLRGYTLTRQSVQEILKKTSDRTVTYEAFVDGKAYADISYVKDPVRYGASERAVAYVQRTRQMEEDIVKFIDDHIDVLDSIDIIVKSEEMKKDIQRILSEVPDVYITSSVRQLVEISHRNAGKKTGLSYVADRLGIRREETAAFGNADNDIDMLCFAGIGVAVADASEGCRKAADVIVARHDEDGVGDWIIDNIFNPF